MRRKILERQNVAGGQRDYGFRIAGGGEFAESAEDRDEFLDGAVVIDNEDERTLGSTLQKHEQQGFRSRSEAGDTRPPRALSQVGGYTRKGGKFFHVREEFADEGKKHAGLF
jgi:hypothetical protein